MSALLVIAALDVPLECLLRRVAKVAKQTDMIVVGVQPQQSAGSRMWQRKGSGQGDPSQQWQIRIHCHAQASGSAGAPAPMQTCCVATCMTGAPKDGRSDRAACMHSVK